MLFLALFTLVIVAVNLAVLRALPLSFTPLGFVYAWLLELYILAFAYDTSQAVLCLVLSERQLPQLQSLQHHPPVALVCLTCDDFDLSILSRLGQQTYPNLDIFILDDSLLPESRSAIDGLPFRVVRRQDRTGFKAGNLNHWLFGYSKPYTYFVVADADSVFPDGFVDAMVRVAEHPGNADLAIIESEVYLWNEDHPFAKPQASSAAFQRCRQLRLVNRLDSTLSVGHNNIYRTGVLCEIGGFAERYIAEDYATTINLLRHTSSKCKTACVKSYERAPANFSEYARREARWAYQTFQLCSLATAGLCWEVRLALLRTVYHFSLPILTSAGMLWLVTVNIGYVRRLASSAPIVQPLDSIWHHPAVAFWLLWLLVPGLLKLRLLVREGVSTRDCLWNSLFQAGLFFASAWPVIRRLCQLSHERGRQFDVTGYSAAPSFAGILKMCGPSFALAWLTLLSFVARPDFMTLNLMWLAPACLAPVLVRTRSGHKEVGADG